MRIGGDRAGGICQIGGAVGIGALPGPARAGGQAIDAMAQEPDAAGDDFDGLEECKARQVKENK